jgi:integrase
VHLAPQLGRIPIQHLRAEQIARMLEELRRAGLAPWTVKGVYVLLSSILSHAQARGLIAESPLKRLAKSERPSGKARSKPRTLTDEECGKLIEGASGVWRVMTAVACATGLRLSELLGLRWEDVDLEDALVRVRYQLSVAHGDRPATLAPLKTGAGERDVYLVAELVALLEHHKADRFEIGLAGAADFVFGTRDGQPLSQRNAGRALRQAGDRACLNSTAASPISWHDLRHTSISRLIAAGLDVVEVQRQAGHARPSITLDVYAHEFEKAKRSDDIRAKIARTGMGRLIGGSL